jgi:hypothetical protein
MRTYGSVRRAISDDRPYRDKSPVKVCLNRLSAEGPPRDD